MAQPVRIEYPGAYYHVTSRGNERKTIFRDDQDREIFLKLLSRAVEQFHLRRHGYVLMEGRGFRVRSLLWQRPLLLTTFRRIMSNVPSVPSLFVIFGNRV